MKSHIPEEMVSLHGRVVIQACRLSATMTGLGETPESSLFLPSQSHHPTQSGHIIWSRTYLASHGEEAVELHLSSWRTEHRSAKNRDFHGVESGQ